MTGRYVLKTYYVDQKQIVVKCMTVALSLINIYYALSFRI